MHRDLILKKLYNYRAKAYPEENVDLIISFVQENKDCFLRENLKGHITSSCWLLNNDMQKALLMHHKKLNLWCQLGGHNDGDNNPLNVSIKEANEESGIPKIIPVYEDIFDIDIHMIPEYKDIPKHYHYDLRFLLKVDGNYVEKKNDESNELKWVTKDIDSIPTRSRSIIRMVEKWNKIDI